MLPITEDIECNVVCTFDCISLRGESIIVTETIVLPLDDYEEELSIIDKRDIMDKHDISFILDWSIDSVSEVVDLDSIYILGVCRANGSIESEIIYNYDKEEIYYHDGIFGYNSVNRNFRWNKSRGLHSTCGFGGLSQDERYEIKNHIAKRLNVNYDEIK